MNLNEIKQEIYKLTSRVKERAQLSDRTLDEHDMERIDALMGALEVFTKQHHSNCE